LGKLAVAPSAIVLVAAAKQAPPNVRVRSRLHGRPVDAALATVVEEVVTAVGRTVGLSEIVPAVAGVAEMRALGLANALRSLATGVAATVALATGPAPGTRVSSARMLRVAEAATSTDVALAASVAPTVASLAASLAAGAALAMVTSDGVTDWLPTLGLPELPPPQPDMTALDTSRQATTRGIKGAGEAGDFMGRLAVRPRTTCR
jgi:hypothetical protein